MAGNMNTWVDVGAPISFPIAALPPANIYQLNDTGGTTTFTAPTEIYPQITPFLFPPDPRSSTNKLGFLPTRMSSYGTNYYDQLGFGVLAFNIPLNTNIGLLRGGKFNDIRRLHNPPDPDAQNRHFSTLQLDRRGGLFSVRLYSADSSSSDFGFRCTYIPGN